MEAPAQAALHGLADTKETAMPVAESVETLHHVQTPPSDDDDDDKKAKKRSTLKLNRTTAAFFLLGLLVGLPATVTTTNANAMFAGITGVYDLCNSATAAVASLLTPFMARYISYNNCTALCTVCSILAYIVCTLPHPLADSGSNKAGPVVGTLFAGFVYAFGTNIYMSVAAFFPPEAVLALSAGSGCSVILGPGIFIAVMAGFEQDWRRSFLVIMSTTIFIPVIWWGLTDASCRKAAERSRLASLEKHSAKTRSDSSLPASDSDIEKAAQIKREGEKPGFGPSRTRLGLLFSTLLPKYILPLILCTSTSTLSTMGTAPTVQTLNRFRAAPEGDMQFQLVFLTYGSAQFLFSTLSGFRPIPYLWIWTIVQIGLTVIGLIQIFRPFLTYYGVWIVVMFFVGGCVGGGVTNTNHKIAEDFRLAGEPDEVRSFAMSFAGFGNFGGDAIGAGIAIMIQQLATRNLQPS